MAERRDIATRFREGNPGGPGRPKGSKSLSTLIKEYLDSRTIGDEKLEGKKRAGNEVVEHLFKRATGRKSDASLKAIDMILDRTEGKVAQAIDVPAVSMETVAEMNRDDERCDTPDAEPTPPEVPG